MAFKVGIYVDCGSLRHSSLAFVNNGSLRINRPRVDYERLLEIAKGDGDAQAYAYVMGRANVSTNPFCDALSRMGYTPEVIPEHEARTARLELISDAIVDECDAIVVVSDDTFFRPFVAELAARGKKVALAHFMPGVDIPGVRHIRLGRDVIREGRDA